jgi:hypothetical protein
MGPDWELQESDATTVSEDDDDDLEFTDHLGKKVPTSGRTICPPLSPPSFMLVLRPEIRKSIC